MGITLQEFLRKKGAIGLLSLLHERPRTYSEIEPEIEVVSDTIITRRDEAAELGLLNISLGDADVGTKKVYHLTDMGEFLTEKMAREGLISNYRKMRTLEQLVDEQTDTVVRWVGENPSQLLQFEEADGTIIQDQSQTDPSPTGETNPGDDETGQNANTAAIDDGGDEGSEGNEGTEQEESSDESDLGNQGAESREQPPTATVEEQLEDVDPSNTSQGSLSDLGPGEPDDGETD